MTLPCWSGLKAQDEDTVVFHMSRPYSIWPYTMAVTGIVPEHAYGPDYGVNPIGSGRYIMKQWDRGQQVIFEANPDYYGEEPRMKKVTVLFMEEDAAFAAALAGQADVVYTAASYTDQEVTGYHLLACESVDNRGFNLPAVPRYTDENGIERGNDFTADVRVRRAISMGLDRQAMIDHVLNGYGSPAYSVCDKLPWYNEEAETAYDPEQAKALLDEAGWTPGADGIRTRDGGPRRAGIYLSGRRFCETGSRRRHGKPAEGPGDRRLCQRGRLGYCIHRGLFTAPALGMGSAYAYGALQYLPHKPGYRHCPVFPVFQ